MSGGTVLIGRPAMRILLRVFLPVAVMIPVSSGCQTPGSGFQSPLIALEHSLLFHPSPYPAGDWNPNGLSFEDAWFTAPDGTPLHGWYVPHPRPRAVVLLAHGNAGNLSHRAEMLRVLHDRHAVSVMTFDYRGYGKSDGSPSEAGILQDARAARAWLSERARVDEVDITLMGRSLGGGVAVDLAAGDGARGLVLISTFTSLPDTAREMFGWLPVAFMRSKLDSRSKIASYQGPLLQSHGDADQVVGYELGRELHAAANRPKQFVRVSGGSHNAPLTEEFHQAFDAFIASLPENAEPQ